MNWRFLIPLFLFACSFSADDQAPPELVTRGTASIAQLRSLLDDARVTSTSSINDIRPFRRAIAGAVADVVVGLPVNERDELLSRIGRLCGPILLSLDPRSADDVSNAMTIAVNLTAYYSIHADVMDLHEHVIWTLATLEFIDMAESVYDPQYKRRSVPNIDEPKSLKVFSAGAINPADIDDKAERMAYEAHMRVVADTQAANRIQSILSGNIEMVRNNVLQGADGISKKLVAASINVEDPKRDILQSYVFLLRVASLRVVNNAEKKARTGR